MHADKIGAKKENHLSWWILKFGLEPFVSCNSQKVTSPQTIKRYTQDQRLKLTPRTMEKVILILQRVISVFKIQDNQKIALNSVCWIFDRRSLNFKKYFQKPTSLISFQQLDLNRHDPWKMRFDSRTLIEFAKSLVEMTSTFLDTPWKVNHLGAIQWTLRKKKPVFRSVGGKEKIKWWVVKVHQSYV